MASHINGNSAFRLTTEQTTKLKLTVSLWRESAGDRWTSSLRANNVEAIPWNDIIMAWIGVEHTYSSFGNIKENFDKLASILYMKCTYIFVSDKDWCESPMVLCVQCWIRPYEFVMTACHILKFSTARFYMMCVSFGEVVNTFRTTYGFLLYEIKTIIDMTFSCLDRRLQFS